MCSVWICSRLESELYDKSKLIKMRRTYLEEMGRAILGGLPLYKQMEYRSFRQLNSLRISEIASFTQFRILELAKAGK